MPSAWGHTRLLETDWRLITQESHCFSCGSVKGDFSLEILSSQKDSSKLRIKNSTGSAIIHFRPKFKLFIDVYFPDK
ncbi:hypothetical protein SAMN04488695_1112 [Proteiniclasticum ruminis]|uniref:Uncharacterized protein n=1 Tax=Proteiniclasticum ruminis TaxID=398199 RepID=A0A1I5DT49_9CLOT|nr:hypothetical protein SAMN04488695_1112 [Proteiniclasticum ruminis]